MIGLCNLSIVVLAGVLTRIIYSVMTWYDYEPVITQEEEDFGPDQRIGEGLLP